MASWSRNWWIRVFKDLFYWDMLHSEALHHILGQPLPWEGALVVELSYWICWLHMWHMSDRWWSYWRRWVRVRLVMVRCTRHRLQEGLHHPVTGKSCLTGGCICLENIITSTLSGTMYVALKDNQKWIQMIQMNGSTPDRWESTRTELVIVTVL